MKREHEASGGAVAGSMESEAVIRVPERTFIKLVEKALIEPFAPLAALEFPFPKATGQNRILPRIGTEWNGGIYAGFSVHDNEPTELVLLPGDFEGKWDDAVKWADEQGGTLPSRIDQLVLLKNLKKEFKDEYYWSAEQHAGDDEYAWGQFFGNGNQDCYLKGHSYRARAVRRVIR